MATRRMREIARIERRNPLIRFPEIVYVLSNTSLNNIAVYKLAWLLYEKMSFFFRLVAKTNEQLELYSMCGIW
jgi:hypothetical protein